METLKLTNKDLKLINSKNGLLSLLSQNTPDVARSLDELNYQIKVRKLQVELIKLQSWVVRRNKRIIILFEGRDLAGRSNAIKQFSEHLNPRNMRTVALPKPTPMQKKQWYFRRYISMFPHPGEIVFFNRSWYNRAIVEPVNGFCSKNHYRKFMMEVNQFEEMIMNDGIQLIKFYFSISREEQARRLNSLKNDPLRKWRITKLDLKAQELWDQYTVYKEKMFEATDRNNSPWIIIDANDSLKANIESIEYVLNQAMYS